MIQPPHKIAFIIDNEVVEVLHTEDRLAAILLSNPTILDVTNQVVTQQLEIAPGLVYDLETNTFSLPKPPETTPVVTPTTQSPVTE